MKQASITYVYRMAVRIYNEWSSKFLAVVHFVGHLNGHPSSSEALEMFLNSLLAVHRSYPPSYIEACKNLKLIAPNKEQMLSRVCICPKICSHCAKF